MKKPKAITKDRLESFRNNGHLTIGGLKRWLLNNSDLPDDSLVMIQRIPDMYYEGMDISGMGGAEEILPPGSKSEGWDVYYKDSDMGEEQYSPAWCCVRFNDEDRLMFMDLHY